MRMYTRYVIYNNGFAEETALIETDTGVQWHPREPDRYALYIDTGDALRQWVGDYLPDEQKTVDKVVHDFNKFMYWLEKGRIAR